MLADIQQDEVWPETKPVYRTAGDQLSANITEYLPKPPLELDDAISAVLDGCPEVFASLFERVRHDGLTRSTMAPYNNGSFNIAAGERAALMPIVLAHMLSQNSLVREIRQDSSTMANRSRLRPELADALNSVFHVVLQFIGYAAIVDHQRITSTEADVFYQIYTAAGLIAQPSDASFTEAMTILLDATHDPSHPARDVGTAVIASIRRIRALKEPPAQPVRNIYVPARQDIAV